jgi:hypothetical protein
MYSMAPSEIAGLLVLGAIFFASVTVLALCLPGRGKHMKTNGSREAPVNDDRTNSLEPMSRLPTLSERWTVRRKAEVVEAVRRGWVAIEEACRLYQLSVDEFVAWQRDLDRYGVPGLRVTRYQIYRDIEVRRG